MHNQEPQTTPSVGANDAPLNVAMQQAHQFVRLTEKALSEMSDEALHQYIKDAGRLMLEAEDRYQRESFLADKGERDGLWLTQRHALLERARRAHIIATMERERGLA